MLPCASGRSGRLSQITVEKSAIMQWITHGDQTRGTECSETMAGGRSTTVFPTGRLIPNFNIMSFNHSGLGMNCFLTLA
jgi:hypothetical protein